MGDLRAWTETLELNLRSVKAELEHSKVNGDGRGEDGHGASPARTLACMLLLFFAGFDARRFSGPIEE